MARHQRAKRGLQAARRVNDKELGKDLFIVLGI